MDLSNTYSFPGAKSIVVCGDIHGDFNSVVHKLCVQYQMTDTVLVIDGDCGFGFEKLGYYENVFKRNSVRLSKANNWVVMLRGNHDDPSYFQEIKISHERFCTIPDYSVIQACGHSILCIGGAVSIDRSHRIDYDKAHVKSGKSSYWTDEMPVYDAARLDEIGASLKIDTVISHTAPSFCELISKNGLAQWASQDSKLLADCETERQTIDKILSHLKSSGHPIKHWYYGHFHQSWNAEIDSILFSMLDIMEFKELR